MSDLRTVVNDHWDALYTRSRGSAWLTSALPVEAAGSSVLCAIGPEGRRHLLVPAPSGADVQTDARAAAVNLLPLALQTKSGPRNYANLELLRDDLSDIFTGLCADVIGALALEVTNNPLAVVTHVLDGWHELFRSGGRIGIEQLAGLFGELSFLNSLLDLNAELVHAWLGPLRSPHDFVANGWAAEVKATTAAEGRSVRVHGIDQLAVPADGGLMLVWMRLATSDAAGTSLPALVDSTARRIRHPLELWHLLAREGYMMADRGRYDGIRFTVVETAVYRVTDEFPRIVSSSFSDGLPAGISSVRYTVDLDFGPPPMQTDEIAVFMEAMTSK